MTTLTPYQQAVLTELGIIQWQLRDKSASDQAADVTPSTAAMIPPADSAPRANAQSAIARLKLAMQDSTAIQSQPEPAQASGEGPVSALGTEPAPKTEALWVADSEPMLSDVLLALNWPDGQQSLRWQQADELKLADGILYCPEPAALAADSRLKRRLWLLLQAC
ncbi:hypothetical protein KJY73_19345 [Bowmanella sp. Y26]|uniref:hypothetical protein n=1 Tax=Bowmanella yangjiangensis TaxID=2811230 RepID=UPI001BDD054B|nr:hypothetical protein [Bowmanella yangjiangensis]MBT1065740.1 hypothetical protein [Bowmanella yangjiangensis]